MYFFLSVQYDQTSVSLASWKGNRAVIEVLLLQGNADVNICDKVHVYRYTLLHVHVHVNNHYAMTTWNRADRVALF